MALRGYLSRLCQHPAVVRLRATVKLGRVEVSTLHGANRTCHIAIARIRDALQARGQVEQEGVTACDS